MRPLPLGNGALGAGLWSADGLTAQLNRADTMPERLSPGHLVVPGLGGGLAGAEQYLTRPPPSLGRSDSVPLASPPRPGWPRQALFTPRAKR
jgi:hypothetical protein